MSQPQPVVIAIKANYKFELKGVGPIFDTLAFKTII